MILRRFDLNFQKTPAKNILILSGSAVLAWKKSKQIMLEKNMRTKIRRKYLLLRLVPMQSPWSFE